MRKPLVRHFEGQGYAVRCFDYKAATEPLAEIQRRLLDLLREAAKLGPYDAIGYSFGGVLLRIALSQDSAGAVYPARIVLLASPLKGMRLAKALKDWRLYRLFTGEPGQFVANDQEMSSIPWPAAPVASIYGVWPWLGVLGFITGFRSAHDGMVTAEEASSPLVSASFAISASHALMPQSSGALSAASIWLSGCEIAGA